MPANRTPPTRAGETGPGFSAPARSSGHLADDTLALELALLAQRIRHSHGSLSRVLDGLSVELCTMEADRRERAERRPTFLRPPTTDPDRSAADRAHTLAEIQAA